MSDRDRRGPGGRPPQRNYLLWAGLALVVVGILLIVAQSTHPTFGLVVAAAGLVVLIVGPIVRRRR